MPAASRDMVFSSHLFIYYFLPLVLLVYYAAPRRGRHLVLTLFSYLFYGWANPLFTVLMLVTTLIDFVAGYLIAYNGWRGWGGPGQWLEKGGARSRTQRVALIVSVAAHLVLLGFFKYFNFATENYNVLVAALGLPDWRWDEVWKVTLPLGISFYTFQSMSYAIDVYRGDAKIMRHFLDFACFVAMFPQLVAGPIIRFSEVADQLVSRTHTLEKFARGIGFLSVGMAKKILLANPCGKVADTTFDAVTVGCLDSWFGVVAYAFQIYFDFSAYSDMAIGMGLMFGFMFAKNFDSPYQSQSITEFWRRWHLSLSTFLRDYLYIPLGGNRRGEIRTYINLMLTMLLGGLWHGASWNFVIWGGIHGGMLALERARGKASVYHRLPGPIKTLVTFVIVLFTWVFFRAADLPRAVDYCMSMLGFGADLPAARLVQGLIYQPYYALVIAAAMVVTWFCPQTWDWTKHITPWKAAACVVLFAVSMLVLATQAYNPFIYFIF